MSAFLAEQTEFGYTDKSAGLGRFAAVEYAADVNFPVAPAAKALHVALQN